MGKLLLVISLLWTYAYFVEIQTTWYAHEPIEWEVISYMAHRYTPQLLIMLLGNALLPIFCMCIKRLRRSIGVMLVVSLMVNVAMFIERFLIIVPSLSHKNMPFAWGSYSPSLVEVSVNLAALAGFCLLFTLFAKFFPIVALTDVRELEARQTDVGMGRARLTSTAKEE
jgi:molybdopterin-containing oxidoreductase family membrane subunit